MAIQMVLSFFLVAGIRRVFATPSDLRANWIFRLSWDNDADRYLRGVRRAVKVGLLLPLFAVLAAIQASLWGPQVVAAHFIAGWLASACLADAICPAVEKAGIPWYGLHAFRRGLATNLHDLGISDIVIQAILRHSNVSVIREAYIKNDAVDPRSLAAMDALESAVCNQHATETSEADDTKYAKPLIA
jgi:hypothetical protein